MTQKTSSLLFTPDISPVHASSFYSSPNFRPVAACRWHNPGNQKLRALQRKKETWGKKFFQRQREGPIITIFGHACSHASPAQTTALTQIPQRFSSPFFKAEEKSTGSREKETPLLETDHSYSVWKKKSSSCKTRVDDLSLLRRYIDVLQRFIVSKTTRVRAAFLEIIFIQRREKWSSNLLWHFKMNELTSRLWLRYSKQLLK